MVWQAAPSRSILIDILPLCAMILNGNHYMCHMNVVLIRDFVIILIALDILIRKVSYNCCFLSQGKHISVHEKQLTAKQSISVK